MFFEVMIFIFGCISQFIAMLFTIMLSPTMSLGLFMCILFILVPILVSVFCMLKNQEMAYQIHEWRSDLHARYDYKGNHSSRGKHEKGGYRGSHRIRESKSKNEQSYKPKHAYIEDK